MNQVSAKLLAMLSAIALLTVVPAVMHGRFMNRWGPVADLESAAERLQRCPDQIGDWKTVSDNNELSESVIRELQIAGYLGRTYAHQNSGQRIDVLLMVGAPGAISRHPPEVCYAGANKCIGTPKQVNVMDDQQSPHGFRLLRYQRAGQAGTRFLVCYGFSVDGVWSSPGYPRIQFGGQPLLYKMQVLFEVESPDGELPTVVSQFLGEFLPAFRDNCVENE